MDKNTGSRRFDGSNRNQNSIQFLAPEMAQVVYQWKLLTTSKSIGRFAISGVFVFFTQFALTLVPRYFQGSSFLTQLAISAVVVLPVMGLSGRCRRLIGVRGSAPAFVFFNILFVWCVYIVVLRKATSLLMDVFFNAQAVLLTIGLCRIILSNPGLVTHVPSYSDNLVDGSVSGNEIYCEKLEGPSSSNICHENPAEASVLLRIRYCGMCKAYIKGFDHHCPAFGNCIGQSNHALFLALLLGFIATEASYLVCSSEFATEYEVSDRSTVETTLSRNLVVSTMLFSILQLAWQGVFLAWHVYCVCMNIRTDEWINWKKYSEFQVVQSQSEQGITRMKFRNPYHKGILLNVKEFLA